VSLPVPAEPAAADGLPEPAAPPTGRKRKSLRLAIEWGAILVNKLSYDFHGVHRGDIVVFNKPPNDTTPGVKDLIKRVIGLPGETISGQNGQVYINDHPLAEPWLPKGETTQPFPATRIPAGDYFMMGDNRGDSADSRIIGPIPKRLFIGRAFLRVWPLSRIGTL
jgi:signal peptidase I